MSISLKVVNEAAVFCDCLSLSAIRFRIEFILTRLSVLLPSPDFVSPFLSEDVALFSDEELEEEEDLGAGGEDDGEGCLASVVSGALRSGSLSFCLTA